jgi:hypothetical protein
VEIKRDTAATREPAIVNRKSIDTTRRDVEAAWSDITGLRNDVKKIEAAAEVSNQTLQRLRRDTDARLLPGDTPAPVQDGGTCGAGSGAERGLVLTLISVRLVLQKGA